MSFGAGQVEDAFDRMTRLLHHAFMPSEALVREVAIACCKRPPIPVGAGGMKQIEEFMKAGAWLDAALAIIEWELPQWTLRRLLYEDGEWHCSLSRQPDMPIEFDDTADGRHAVLQLAVLTALVEACRRPECKTRPVVLQSDGKTTQSVIVMCCDDFG